ncbi:MAG TPA: DUF401 family protein [Firmicutes bacterium]|nr:DUF401 family protein [Candidatus Fermentithermobacillaceae bacterium]
MHYVGLALSFFVIMYLSAKRRSFSQTMFVAALVVAVTSTLPPAKVADIAIAAVIDRSTLELAGTVFAIGVFAAIMNHLNFLEKMSSSLQTAFSARTVSAFVPALIGAMPVMGGAQVSAPLVDKTGDKLGLDRVTKAAANIIFRHGMFFLFPFSPSLILLSKMTGIAVWTLISRLWPASVLLWGIGYAVLLSPGNPKTRRSDALSRAVAVEPSGDGMPELVENVETPFPSRLKLEAFRTFLFYGSPLIVALGISLALQIPLWASLLVGSLLACGLGYWKTRSIPPLQEILRNSNLSQVPAMFWIMVFRAFILESPALPALTGSIGGNVGRIGALAVAVPLAFGFVSASQTTSLGVLIPVFMPALEGAPAGVKLSAISAIYISSFLSYLVSPLHLCQILTCQFFDVSEIDVYKRYWPTLVGPVLLMVLYAVHVAMGS